MSQATVKAFTIVVLACACVAGYFLLNRAPIRIEPGGNVPPVNDPVTQHSSKTTDARAKRDTRARAIRPVLADRGEASRHVNSVPAHGPSDSAIPIYREDVYIPRFPRVFDLHTGDDEIEILRKYGDPDLHVVTSEDGKYQEKFIYISHSAEKTTSVEIRDGRVTGGEMHYFSPPTPAPVRTGSATR